MSMFDDVPTDNIAMLAGAGAGGGVMDVAWTPAIGELWEVLYCDVLHNDAAGPVGAFIFTDGVAQVQIGNGAALVVNVRRALYDAGFGGKLYLDHRCTLTWHVGAGATNGAVAYLNVIGRRIRGTQ
jgi:hypothetical protein